MSDDLHTEMLHAAFFSILEQERKISAIKTQRVTVTTELDLQEGECEKKVAEAWKEIETLMAETGEYEAEIPGEGCNYKIAWNKPKKSVEVDDDAAPEQYCKKELKPKLKEIKELLETGIQLNWARFKEGKKELVYRVIKG